MPSQESIGVPEPNTPNPADHHCEWCGPPKPANVALPVMRKVKGRKGEHPTGQWVYACWQHKAIAEALNYVRGTK